MANVKSPSEARDKGYSDAVRHSQNPRGAVEEVIAFIDGKYDYQPPDKFKESYRQGWKEGEKR